MIIPWIRARWLGLATATAIAIVATMIGHLLPIVGAPVSGIVIGVVVGALLKPGARLKPGIQFSSKFVLQLSVVILGFQLSLAQAARVGLESLPVMLGTLVICLVLAWLLGRWLGVVGNMRTLIGVGTGICGASAIAAVTPVIGAVGVDVAYAISTIFLFNIIAVVAFPIIGHLLGMSQHAFGLFAGTAVNDTSSVVAAASTYGTAATNYAVVVKLVRTLMIIPISIGLAAMVNRREPVPAMLPAGGASSAEGEFVSSTEAGEPDAPPRRSRVRVFKLIPWFLIGFVVTAGINSFGFIPAQVHSALSAVSVFLITIALSAIGLSTDLGGFRRAGAKPLLLGLCLWVAVTLSSLGLQFALGIH
jgi:uncharacterized integral membrane protein (TIGR00698 family)